jgi:hypothetical protein
VFYKVNVVDMLLLAVICRVWKFVKWQKRKSALTLVYKHDAAGLYSHSIIP